MLTMKTRSRGNASGLPDAALPVPAPLPSLPTAFSRRAALFGAVTATGFLAAAGTSALDQGSATTASPPAIDPAADPDPIFAAIDRHREAVAAFEASFDESAGMVHVPVDIEARQELAGDVETDARYDMHQVVPTTLAGLAAYIAHWNTYTSPPGLKVGPLEEIGWQAIPTIAAAMATLLPAGGARG